MLTNNVSKDASFGTRILKAFIRDFTKSLPNATLLFSITRSVHVATATSGLPLNVSGSSAIDTRLQKVSINFIKATRQYNVFNTPNPNFVYRPQNGYLVGRGFSYGIRENRSTDLQRQ
jgi:hypothetical protein